MSTTKQKLLENFDEEVHDKLKINLAESREYISKYESLLWQLTKDSLKEKAIFDEELLSFQLVENGLPTPLGNYKLGKKKMPTNMPIGFNILLHNTY